MAARISESVRLVASPREGIDPCPLIAERTNTSNPCLTRGIQAVRSPILGAPRIGDRTAWIPRVKQGFEVLVRSAIKGHGSMPSRGDATNLTDSEIRAAIAYMVNPDSATTTRPSLALVAGPDRDGHNIDWAAKYTG